MKLYYIFALKCVSNIEKNCLQFRGTEGVSIFRIFLLLKKISKIQDKVGGVVATSKVLSV